MCVCVCVCVCVVCVCFGLKNTFTQMECPMKTLSE